jgi:hypothetical protein
VHGTRLVVSCESHDRDTYIWRSIHASADPYDLVDLDAHDSVRTNLGDTLHNSVHDCGEKWHATRHRRSCGAVAA